MHKESVIKIMFIKDSDFVFLNELTCSEHGSYATKVINIHGMVLLLCDSCIQELKEELNKIND